MERAYTEVGYEYNSEDVRPRLEKAIDNLEWQSLPVTLGAMPAMNIRETIEEFRIPKVSHIAVSAELAPYGLYGIRGYYKNGMVELYVIDSGDAIIPVATDFYPYN